MEDYMEEKEAKPVRFLGTYFDPENVLRAARWAEILSWVVVVVYVVDMLMALVVFVLQYARGFMQGLGFTDVAQQVLYLLERPFRGIVYFVVLQAIAKGLLILMDMEENTRRASRR
jgi:hypothetical protein